MLGVRTVRRRLFLAILAVSLLPAAAALLAGTAVLREAGATSGTLGPWDAVAASGEALAGEALRAAPDDSAVVAAARSHRRALSESLRRSHLWAFVAERFLRVLPLLALGSVAVLGALAAAAAALLSRSFSGPIHELVGWTHRIARSEPLPSAAAERGAAEVVEFAELRDSLRSMAAQLAEARHREVEAARLQAWTDMARRVAHDLKNPLTPMQLAAAALARSDDPRTAEAAALLLEEIGRLDELARSFAHLGRAPETPPSDVDLEALLRSLARHHGSEGVTVRVHASAPPVVVRGHYDLLERVFRNVVVNAVEASARGSAVIDIHLRRSNGAARVTVRDHGPGVSEELLDAIWLPDVSTKRGGTGLGLAIVRQGVEAHAGTARMRNAEGGGAEIEIVLPLEGGDGRREVSGEGRAWTS